MVKKVKTEHLPDEFYDNNTIPSESHSTYYYALDKNADAANVLRVMLLSELNKQIDKMGSESSNKELADILGCNPSVISRIRRYKYKDLGPDLLMKILQQVYTINKRERLSGREAFNNLVNSLNESYEKEASV